MSKIFMKLLKAYIDEMKEQWEVGEYHRIYTLAVAITDMTKNSDMLELVVGRQQLPGAKEQVLHRAARELIEESGGEY